MYEDPIWRSIPTESPTLTLVDCPECDGRGFLNALTSGAATGVPFEQRACGSCQGAGRVEFQKRLELLQRQVRLMAASEPATAEFVGGPLSGQLQQLSEPLLIFQWAHALSDDWTTFRDIDEYQDTLPRVDEYTYERQRFYSSRGNAVYLCTGDDQ